MKLEDVPHDARTYYEGLKRRTYAIDTAGHHVEADQTGWEVETEANELAWIEVKRKVEEARQAALCGERSPLAVHIEARMTELPILRAQSRLWPWRLSAALKPAGYARLSAAERARLETALRLEPGSLDDISRYEHWMELIDA